MAAEWLGGLRRMWRRDGGPDDTAEAFEPLVGEDVELPREEPPINCPELGPFMRVLHDAGVVAGDRGPNQSGMDTYWRLQHLAYLAEHNFGHPGLRYRYDTHANGPYSLGLACDFYGFDSMCDSEPVDGSRWKDVGAFLEFARNYRSRDWLSVASTLSHVNGKMLAGEATCSADHAHGHRSCLVELAYEEMREFTREGIFQVYDSIKNILPLKARQDGIAA